MDTKCERLFNCLKTSCFTSDDDLLLLVYIPRHSVPILSGERYQNHRTPVNLSKKISSTSSESSWPTKIMNIQTIFGIPFKASKHLKSEKVCVSGLGKLCKHHEFSKPAKVFCILKKVFVGVL